MMGSLELQHGVETLTSKDDDQNPYTILEEPIGRLRRVRIVTIGAGASGINMIRTLRLHTSNFEHVVYEKNPEIGGTWYENRYPGCRCDIPSHNYQFSHTPNPGWSALFSEAREIQEYLLHVCEVHDLKSSIKVSHSVAHAQWDEAAAEWALKVKNEVTGEVFEDRCHFLLDASGILNAWKWPSIDGLHSFKGDLVHSASWPETFDYKKKRVAVIGNGSSGIQIIPEIQRDVETLVHFVRTPTWVPPPQRQIWAGNPNAKFISSIKMDSNDNFTEEQIEEFKADPEFYMRFVKAVENEVNSKFKMLINGSPEAGMARNLLTGFMGAMLRHDEHLTKTLIPNFPVGCRRITPGIGYLQALGHKNVRVIGDEIEEICAEGFKLKNGDLIEVDAVICATGFDVSFVPRFPLIGENGNLQDIWKEELPSSYLSCMVAGLPNYFTFLGPNSPIGHGSVLTITEHLAKYITKVIKKCQLEHTLSIRPSQAAVDDYSEHIAIFMPRTAWASPCPSWFKSGASEGPVTALHPGSRIHWFHMLENPRWEDFEWKRVSRNRFQYLGNGFSTKETEGDDPAWYLDEPDAM